jgi:hypothetical protein
LPLVHPELSSRSPARIGHKKFGIGEARKPWIYVVSGDRTVAAEVRVKRDGSRSETDFEVFGSLWGSVATGKTAWKLGIFWPREAHLIDLH